MLSWFGNRMNFNSGFDSKEEFNELVTTDYGSLCELKGDYTKEREELLLKLKTVESKKRSIQRILRVRELLHFDYVTALDRVKDKINFNKRKQDFSFQEMFPDPNQELLKCACGCMRKVRPKGSGKWKWATTDCQTNANEVYMLLKYGTSHALPYLLGKSCIECGSKEDIEYDHVQSIEDGGGASWFDNFQPLCKKCHGKKTSVDYQNRKAKYNQDRLK